jgi:hypothetical protein
MEAASEGRHRGRQPGRRIGNPARYGQRAYAKAGNVKSAERNWQRSGWSAGKPVAGEGWNNTPTDQRDQQQDDANTKPHAVAADGVRHCFPMKNGVADQEQHQQSQDLDIAHVASCNNFARDDTSKATEKQKIDHGGQRCTDSSRSQYRQPASCPGGHQRQKRAASDRKTAGPVWDRRQQEAGYDAWHIAIQEFMYVPFEWGKRCWWAECTAEHRQPDGKHRCRPDRTKQKEWSEPVAEDRRPAVGSHALGGRSHWVVPSRPTKEKIIHIAQQAVKATVAAHTARRRGALAAAAWPYSRDPGHPAVTSIAICRRALL